jgi:hypothetical protein
MRHAHCPVLVVRKEKDQRLSEVLRPYTLEAQFPRTLLLGSS